MLSKLWQVFFKVSMTSNFIFSHLVDISGTPNRKYDLMISMIKYGGGAEFYLFLQLGWYWASVVAKQINQACGCSVPYSCLRSLREWTSGSKVTLHVSSFLSPCSSDFQVKQIKSFEKEIKLGRCKFHMVATIIGF